MRPLTEYTRKRDFKITPEPGAKLGKFKGRRLIFVVQEHHASHLHYDFRLEWNGVLKSWSVPKGPSMNPKVKRLAVEVEDHPVEYAKFTGTIPKHQYGAGEVYRWDMGTWTPLGDVDRGLKEGRLEFELKGKKLKGKFILIRTKMKGAKPNWFLIKRTQDDVRITHPERVIFAKEKITKLEIVEYYRAVADWLLPYIQDRPLALIRCPQSSTKSCFFSKHFGKNPPAHVLSVPEKGKQPWVAVDSVEGLIDLVQWGTVEIHPWSATRAHLERPDQIVMDFDPAPGVEFKLVKAAARELKEILDELGLRSFVKATGGKGLHVQFPIVPVYEWEEVRAFAKSLVQEMVSRRPKLYTANMNKRARRGKIFIDYLRNGRGATAVAPYSLRAKDISAVAMPLDWKTLGRLKSSSAFTLEKALRVLKRRKSDPWREYFNIRQKIALLS